MNSTAITSLTQQLLDLLQTHVDVHTGVVVVWQVTGISQAIDPFQQDEEDETRQFPQHRVRPTLGLSCLSKVGNRHRCQWLYDLQVFLRCSPVATFFLSACKKHHYSSVWASRKADLLAWLLYFSRDKLSQPQRLTFKTPQLSNSVSKNVTLTEFSFSTPKA